MKRFKLSELFVSFCFLAFLFGAMVITVVRDKEAYSFFENRTLAARPVYTAEADGNGTYVNQWERYLSDHAALRNTLLKVKTRLDLALHRPVVNEVVVGDGILLPYLPAEQADEKAVSAQAEAMADNLKRISDTVAEYGGCYCYVCVPCQYDYFPDRYPWYLNNREELTRLSLDELSRAMEERGVDFLNLSDMFRNMGHPEEYSSLVDNHYSMRGAFAAYQRVLEHVRSRTGLDIPILREEDVSFEELPNKYLGSRERKLLSQVNLGEHLYVLHPKEEVPFTRTNNGVEGAATVYALPGSEWDTLTYDLYMGGDVAHSVVDTGREELPSLLIYGDSMTNAMECVIYLSFDETHALDLRHYKDMSLTDYIRLVRPEVVVCVREPEALLDLRFNGGAES